MNNAVRNLWDASIQHGMPDGAFLIIVDARSQQMYLYGEREEITSFPVSISRNGLGEAVHSEQTPRGFHRIAEWYGDGEPVGTQFVSREATGEVLARENWTRGADDKILTRIMRLRGVQPGLNAGRGIDSFERMIYIHGTNQEQYVGVLPSSRGCIRMRNEDVLELYERTCGKETWCWIGDL